MGLALKIPKRSAPSFLQTKNPSILEGSVFILKINNVEEKCSK